MIFKFNCRSKGPRANRYAYAVYRNGNKCLGTALTFRLENIFISAPDYFGNTNRTGDGLTI